MHDLKYFYNYSAGDMLVIHEISQKFNQLD